MKIMHLSDLHLGKRLNEFNLLEDQAYILDQILKMAEEEKPDAAMIAGDVYDKSVPSAEAVELFDDFLSGLAGRVPHVFVISGNHDSAERIAFGGRLMDRSGVHLSPVYRGKVEPVVLKDEAGEVSFYMLPFIKPGTVRPFFPEEKIESYDDALRLAIEQMKVDPAGRNVLITHQFVTGAERSESEDLSVGGTDNVDVSLFADFDYVALGHIHGPQNVGSPNVRYCGTPLKYSFSEAKQTKSITWVGLGKKGDLKVRTSALTPLRELRELKGLYGEITAKKNYEGTNRGDYVHITLTDEEDVPDAIGKLRVIYPNLMKLDYDNTRTRSGTQLSAIENVEKKSPLELFSEFYQIQNGVEMGEDAKQFCSDLIEKIWEEK